MEIEIRHTDDFERLVPLMIGAGLEVRPDTKEPEDMIGCWAAWDAEKLVGCAVLTEQPADELAVLRYVAVEPEMQGRGLGSRMVHIAEHRARERGVKRVVLSARIPEFYAKLGYRIIDRETAPISCDCAVCPQFHNGCESEIMELVF